MAGTAEQLFNPAREAFGQLTAADKKLLRAVARSEEADFQVEAEELNNPVKAEKWGKERTLPANRLIWLATNPQACELLGFRGLRITGAKIVGKLDFQYATVSIPLLFQDCAFTEPLAFQQAKLWVLSLAGSHFPEIQADGIQVERTLNLSKVLAKGMVSLAGAAIEGDLDCSGGQFINPKLNTIPIIWQLLREINSIAGILLLRQSQSQGIAIRALNATVAGNIYFIENFQAEGLVSLMGSTIDGYLSCFDGHFLNERGIAFGANGAKVTGDVFLNNGFEAKGEVKLLNASIDGNFDCSGGRFFNTRGTALNVSGAKFTGDVFLRQGFKAQGQVILTCASIEGNLDCSGGHFLNEKKMALIADEVNIAGCIFLRDGFEAKGEVRLVSALIDRDLDCSGGHFFNDGNKALTADGFKVGGIVYLRQGFESRGEVRLKSASIGGPLECINCHFSNLNQNIPALNLEGANIEGSILLKEGFVSEGQVNLLGVNIEGYLDCSGGHFLNKGNKALVADGAKIRNRVSLNECFTAKGEVRLPGASIGGDLDCSSGNFLNMGKLALNADNVNVTGNVLLHEGFKAYGTVKLDHASIKGSLFCSGITGNLNLNSASIGGNLNCSGCYSFHNFNEKGNGIAIDAESIKVIGTIFLHKGFTSTGEVRFLNASIGGDLECNGSFFDAGSEIAFSIEGATIGGTVYLRNRSQFIGKISLVNVNIDRILFLREIVNSEQMTLDLRFARVNTLADSEDSWPAKSNLHLNGFTYNILDVNSPLDSKRRLKWLRLQPDAEFALQPYEQLAAVLKASGHESAAKEILIGQEEDRRRYGGLRWWGKIWNRFLGLTIAHGYKPEKALLYSLVFVVAGTLLFNWGYQEKLISESNIAPFEPKTKVDPVKYPAFNPLLYSIDVFLPVINFHQENYWLPNANSGNEISLLLFKARQGELLRWYFWFQIMAGWVLASLWIAGFTGLVRSQQ